MTRIALLAIVTFALSACGSPGSLRERGSIAEFSSTKDAKQVAMCIADKWENRFSIGSSPILMRERPSGYSVMLDCGGICIMADSSPKEGGGSQTQLFGGFGYAAPLIKLAGDCQ